jgi:Uma2 family endonuclease
MIQALRKLVTFDEFIAWYPENLQQRYELHELSYCSHSSPPTFSTSSNDYDPVGITCGCK